MDIHFFDNRQRNIEHPLNRDRGFLFGDGFFTTGIVENGILRHREHHFNRLTQAASRLKFGLFDRAEVCSSINAQISKVDSASIRITVSRIQQQRGYGFDCSAPFQVSVQLAALPQVPSKKCQLVFATTPVSTNPCLAGLKHLNRLDNVLAAQEICHPYQESLLCADELVICGSRTNLFIFDGQNWLTPKLDKAGIEGITRQRLLGSLKANNIPVMVSDISREQVIESKAACVTNSLLGIWPVEKIMNKPVATELTENLKSTLNFVR